MSTMKNQNSSTPPASDEYGSSSTANTDKNGERQNHRKAHHKSRLGCVQCKNRRVKCDERYPTCSNCRRRREPCSYSAGAHSAASPDDPERPGSGTSIQQIHLGQLELMHHYCTSTFATIVSIPREQQLAQVEIPRLALAHDFLLDAVFSLTSLHLATLQPESNGRYVEESVRYQTLALAACRRSLDHLTGAQCRAMFHCSAFLGVIAMALHCIAPGTSTSTKPSGILLQSTQLWRGTSLMVSSAQELLDTETFSMYFPQPHWLNLMVAGTPISPAHGLLERLRERAKVLEPRPASSPISPGSRHAEEERSEVYSEAIDKLQKLFQARQREPPAILAWLVSIPASFLEDITRGEPLAVVIGLLYTVLLRELSHLWWAKDFQVQLMEELIQLVPSSDVELAEIAAWVQASSVPSG